MKIKFTRNGNLVSQCILRLKRNWIARISWDLPAPLNISNSGDVLSEWGLVDERGRVLLNSISKLYLVFEKEKRPKNAMPLLGASLLICQSQFDKTPPFSVDGFLMQNCRLLEGQIGKLILSI